MAGFFLFSIRLHSYTFASLTLSLAMLTAAIVIGSLPVYPSQRPEGRLRISIPDVLLERPPVRLRQTYCAPQVRVYLQRASR
jgi:hypothetical protein